MTLMNVLPSDVVVNILLLFCVTVVAAGSSHDRNIRRGRLGHEQWEIKTGRIRRRIGNIHNGGDRSYPCRIPSTVVTCLVENGVFLSDDDENESDMRNSGSDGNRRTTSRESTARKSTTMEFEDAVEKIYYQDNLEKIPDVNVTGRDFYTYDWYLDIPLGLGEDEVASDDTDDETDDMVFYFIHFRGIGYQSRMYYRYDNDDDDNENYDHSSTDIEIMSTRGMWHRHCVDVTPYVRNQTLQTNFFLRIEPPLHPGIVSSACPDVTSEPCGQGGDHQLARDAGAMQFSAGWDWIQGIPDRVTGLFDKVEITRTGPVRIRDGYLQTNSISVINSDNTEKTSDDEFERMGGREKSSASSQIDADVSISTTIINNLYGRAISGIVQLRIFDTLHYKYSDHKADDDDDIIDHRFNRQGLRYPAKSFNRDLHILKAKSLGSSTLAPSSSRPLLEIRDDVCLKAGESRTHRWDNLLLTAVQLWWPHTLGQQPLYTIQVCFSVTVNHNNNHDNVAEEDISDCEEWNAGIRTISTDISRTTGGRYFLINNQRIFLQGGNWIATDAMLQRSSRLRYFNEVLLHRHAGLNLIRVWGGGLTERPEFYEACDRLGMLVMQEFWMSGDNNGRWAGSYDSPDDHSSYLDQAADMVLMIRRHPSLLFYCGGNELWPSNKSPPPDIQEGLRKIIRSLDDRFFIMSSMDGGFKGGDMNFHDNVYALAVEDGPYDFLSPVTYWSERNPGMKNGTIATLAFQPEIGSSGMPRYHSLARMGLVENETDFPRGIDAYVPKLWRYHMFQGYQIRDTTQNNTISDGIAAYGEPKTVRDFVARAQLVCLQQYQSLFEGFASKMFASASEGGKSAVIMWKSQSPWPALRGFLYDWWLGSSGSLIGVQQGTGGESVGKVQLNWNLKLVELVNRGRTRLIHPSSASVEWYDVHGDLLSAQGNISIGVVDPMSVARSSVNDRVLVPRVAAGRVLFVRVMLPPWTPTWYWVSSNGRGDATIGYNYEQLGIWRQDGPFPKISGHVVEGSIKIKGLWWTGIVSITVDPTGGAIAFAPEFSVYDTDSNHMLQPILCDSPIVFMNNGVATNVTVWAQMTAIGQTPHLITVDFWAGEQLRVRI